MNGDDPLAHDEMNALGVTAVENSLPVPHKEGQSAGDANAVKRTMGAVAATARPKRPKTIKFSPSKQKRRSNATNGRPGKQSEPDPSLPNNDWCDTCGGKGHFLCCDGGCLRSFHFVCLEPPVRLDEIADDEAWYCKACRAAKNPPPKHTGLFGELIYKAETENPTIFSLPNEIKNWYKNVTPGPHGEYMNSYEHRPPSKITGRPIGIEDRDGYRLKDKSGKTILCYRCNEAASVTKQRRIISCDFCDQHWHLDCLDPPMTALPPPTRKWMCPVHSDPHLLKKKVPKATQTITVPRPGLPNNGDLIILPAKRPVKPLEEFEDVVVNRVRYQIPEDTVILDFWARVHNGAKFRGLSSPERRLLFKQLTGPNGGNRDVSPNSLGSPLTSLDELSDGEPGQPGARYGSSKSGPSGLDFLAQIAEEAARSLAIDDGTSPAIASEPKKDKDETAMSRSGSNESQSAASGSDARKATVSAHPTNGLIIKLNQGSRAEPSSSSTSRAGPSTSAAGSKKRAVPEDAMDVASEGGTSVGGPVAEREDDNEGEDDNMSISDGNPSDAERAMLARSTDGDNTDAAASEGAFEELQQPPTVRSTALNSGMPVSDVDSDFYDENQERWGTI